MTVSGKRGFTAVTLAAAAVALALAACQSGAPQTGAGASGSGFTYLTDIRSTAGLPPLAPDARLERAAIRQAGYMAGARRMDHSTGWRRDFATRMKREGVESPAAENLANGRMDVARLFEMWMASPGHRRNMLDPRFGRYGLAYAGERDGQRYWALVLGK